MSKNQIFAVLISLVWFTITAFAQTQSQPITFEKWIQTWHLCGPFPLDVDKEPLNDSVHIPGFETDYLKSHGGERSF
ncbi:MAG: hypothetical protein DWQ10_08800, partial [Calditrichaeota bacterium]